MSCDSQVTFINRILFPFLDNCDQELTRVGLQRVSGADPDDYLCIESGKCVYVITHRPSREYH